MGLLTTKMPRLKMPVIVTFLQEISHISIHPGPVPPKRENLLLPCKLRFQEQGNRDAEHEEVGRKIEDIRHDQVLSGRFTLYFGTEWLVNANRGVQSTRSIRSLSSKTRK
jgi:hypothetical protein